MAHVRGREHASGDREALERVIDAAAITPVYQPIIDLATGKPCAYEALARGPRGSALESPAALFDAAERAGLVPRLDWVCRAAAIQGAFDAALLPPAALFVNVEPAAACDPVPAQYEALSRRAQDGLRVVFEFTERALIDHPGEVLRSAAELRRLGAAIALDDVGADPQSLALLPLVAPEVIKLDRRLLQEPLNPVGIATLHAVQAHAEQTGAAVLAEGIETQQHLEDARALGATHGQGWLFGRPGAMPRALSGADATRLTLTSQRQREIDDHDLFDWIARRRPTRRADAGALRAMLRRLEWHAATLGSDAVVLVLCGPEAVSARTVKRYEVLAERVAFAGLLGPQVPTRGTAGLRTGRLAGPRGNPGQIATCVLAPHFAATFVAAPTETPGTLNYCLTYDRHATADVARHLMARIGRQGPAVSASARAATGWPDAAERLHRRGRRLH